MASILLIFLRINCSPLYVFVRILFRQPPGLPDLFLYVRAGYIEIGIYNTPLPGYYTVRPGTVVRLIL